MEKQFVLVWRFNGKNTEIIEGNVLICQLKRSELKKEPQYKKGKLILRTKLGLKENPNWIKKLK